MTKAEELTYLTNLVLEASAWRFSEEDQRDSIRYEVETRIQNLTSELFHEEESTSSDPEYERKKEWAKDKVRVVVDGHVKWYPRDMVEKVPVSEGSSKWKWQVKAS
jgi:hypothetical protein